MPRRHGLPAPHPLVNGTTHGAGGAWRHGRYQAPATRHRRIGSAIAVRPMVLNWRTGAGAQKGARKPGCRPGRPTTRGPIADQSCPARPRADRSRDPGIKDSIAEIIRETGIRIGPPRSILGPSRNAFPPEAWRKSKRFHATITFDDRCPKFAHFLLTQLH